MIGLGGLAYLGVLYAKAMCDCVAVISNTPDKEAEARELGAQHFINAKSKRLRTVCVNGPEELTSSWPRPPVPIL